MLKKLLKYDLKSTLKFILVFYILAIFFSILTRIFLNIQSSVVLNIIGNIFSGALISMMVSILINSLMRSWVRFNSNLYGDESYLTHTLPVSKKDLYLSKVITSILTIFVSFVVIVISLFIAYFSKENLNILKEFLNGIANLYDSSVVTLIITILALVFLELITILQSGYTGIILGHRKNYNKIGYSVLFGFIAYIVIQILVFILLFICALFNQDVMNLFTSNVITNVSSLKTLLYAGIISYMVLYITNYFINIKLFAKGVNVD